MNTYNAKEINISEANLDEFIAELDKCKSNVYLVTDEGDKINLKSQLCRIIGLHHIINGGRFSGGHIECDDVDDAARLFRFNIYGSQN
jgi:hypothetical protein